MEICVPDKLGLERDDLKWRQDQTYVEAFFRVPFNCSPKKVSVQLSKDHIRAVIGERVVLDGELFSTIQLDGSNWYIGERILPQRTITPSPLRLSLCLGICYHLGPVLQLLVSSTSPEEPIPFLSLFVCHSCQPCKFLPRKSPPPPPPARALPRRSPSLDESGAPVLPVLV